MELTDEEYLKRKKQDKFLKVLINLIEEISDKNIYNNNCFLLNYFLNDKKSFKEKEEDREEREENFYRVIEMYKKELKKYL